MIVATGKTRKLVDDVDVREDGESDWEGNLGEGFGTALYSSALALYENQQIINESEMKIGSVSHQESDRRSRQLDT